MFKKQFKIKSQIQLKSSEKKKFGSEVKTLFPLLNDEEIAFFSNNKESIMKIKITTFNEEHVTIYAIDKVPMFFDLSDMKIFLPTVYMCWKFPHIVTKFTTNTPVIEKLKNSADLFVPGVYLDTAEYQQSSFIAKDAAAVNSIDNGAVIAVGQCLISKSQIRGPQSLLLDGRLLKVYHTVGDFLCKSHYLPTPTMDPPLKASEIDVQPETNEEDQIAEKCEELIIKDVIDPSTEPISANQDGGDSTDVQENVPAPISEADERELMDKLLVYCFLKAAKITPKSAYPILPAAFYANHMLRAVPEGESLNVKKTKWKKLSGLLQEMAADGVVKLETLKGNEYKLISVNSSHPTLREFIDPHHTPITVDAAPAAHAATTVQEAFVVTAGTQPLFISMGRQKGDEVTRLDVRAAVTEYIRRENLALPESPDKIRPNDVLAAAIKGGNNVVAPPTMTRLDLLAAILAVMPLRHKVSAVNSRGDLIVHKANLPLVEFDVVTRSGNKKVTIISNVECYGVDVAAFSKSLQHAAAASTSVTGQVPGKKGPQVQVQGNQVLVASKLLNQNHGISEKFMRGLEKAPKSKKK